MDRPGPSGDMRANISRRIVQLHKEFYGKGPTRAKTYYHDDVIVVLMRGAFTRVEETLLERGRGDSVAQQRADFQEVMVDRLRQVIEEETGKTVVAMISGLPTTDGSHRHRDLIGEMFVLESADLLAEEPAGEPPASE
jgi:uncharacterized protein YbcI